MITICLDVHKDRSQVCVTDPQGVVIREAAVETKREEVRALISGLPEPRRVVFEEGPLSVLLRDWLSDLACEIVSSDPARNALISRAEDSNDERDARRLAILDRAGAIRPVYIPPEPYRTLRALLIYEERLTRDRTALVNRLKALCRRCGVRYWRKSVLVGRNRKDVRDQMPNGALRWCLDSLYRRFEELRRERLGLRRVIKQVASKLTVIDRLTTIPGVGHTTARTLVAWIGDVGRFRSRAALCSYAGLGLGQGVTNWKPIGPCRASKRGQRAVKRVLFLAARAATCSHSALAERYRWRVETLHWDDRKAIRDLARKLVLLAARLMREGGTYRDELVKRSSVGAD